MKVLTSKVLHELEVTHENYLQQLYKINERVILTGRGEDDIEKQVDKIIDIENQIEQAKLINQS